MHDRPLGGAVEPADGCPMRRSAGALEPGAESDGNTESVAECLRRLRKLQPCPPVRADNRACW